jgi:hypothetical protein
VCDPQVFRAGRTSGAVPRYRTVPSSFPGSPDVLSRFLAVFRISFAYCKAFAIAVSLVGGGTPGMNNSSLLTVTYVSFTLSYLIAIAGRYVCPVAIDVLIPSIGLITARATTLLLTRVFFFIGPVAVLVEPETTK